MEPYGRCPWLIARNTATGTNNPHEQPRCESCDLEKVAYLIRHAARIVLQWENCQDGGSVDSYTCYTRRTDNPHQWEESVEFPDDTLPF